MLDVLNSIVENTMEDSLKHEVAEILIDMLDTDINNEEVLTTIEDILNHGCQSGIVPALIYYKDTEAFFDRHVDEIFDLYNEAKIEYGEMNIELTRNNLAWFGFETMAQNILYELEVANEF